jgi:GT2 family glycosyltransferase
MESPVCAIIINWNGWQDTIVCLQSLFTLEDAPLDVLVCDNGSTNDSAGHLQQWLDAQAGLHADGKGADGEWRGPGGNSVRRVRVLRLPTNLGYAGAINEGIRWAQAQWQAGRYWLLNNDVQVQPGALRALLEAHRSVPHAGLCGSVLLDWDQPQQVQAVGGVYRRWLGVGYHATRVAQDSAVALDLDYPVGASLYVEQDYLDRVGLMEPSYFLYYEEMDWAERGRRLGYRPVVALRSRLRHKEGASTGSLGGVRRKSMLSERYGVINRLRITRKFWPHCLPVVWGSLWLVVADRLRHREFARARLVLQLMFSPAQWRP